MKGVAKEDRRIPLFWSTLIWLAATWLALTYGLPYLSMWVTGLGQPLPIPGAAMVMYVTVALVGALVYITISDESIQEFLGPVFAFLRGPDPYAPRFRVKRLARLALLLLFPFGAGGLVYSRAAPGVQSPTLLRLQHPTIPGAFERLSNPFREPSDGIVKKWIAEKKFTGSPEEARRAFLDQVLYEGRLIYQINCRPCHGTTAGGDGPMARGFRLKPINFRDAGTIATLVEGYLVWRIKEGGPGLPSVSTPWDSAMPAWKNELTDEEIWKIVLAEYDTAGVEPRKPEKRE